jgi:hypothetical protein
VLNGKKGKKELFYQPCFLAQEMLSCFWSLKTPLFALLDREIEDLQASPIYEPV